MSEAGGFVKVRRGLLDAKHVRKMGPALWLFLWLLATAKWSTGIVRWNIGQAADDLGIDYFTAKKYRHRLERAGYIKSQTTLGVNGHIESSVKKWIDPAVKVGTKRPTSKAGEKVRPEMGTQMGTQMGTELGMTAQDSSYSTDLSEETEARARAASTDPVDVFRSVSAFQPNDYQESLIRNSVPPVPERLAVWRGTVEHWLGHDWKPGNVVGMLELYAAGGASACRSCQSHKPGGNGRTAEPRPLIGSGDWE